MAATAQSTIALAEEFLASYRGKLGDAESMRRRNEARTRLQAKLTEMGVDKIGLMTQPQLRAFSGWLKANMGPGHRPLPIPTITVERPNFGRRKTDQ